MRSSFRSLRLSIYDISKQYIASRVTGSWSNSLLACQCIVMPTGDNSCCLRRQSRLVCSPSTKTFCCVFLSFLPRACQTIARSVWERRTAVLEPKFPHSTTTASPINDGCYQSPLSLCLSLPCTSSSEVALQLSFDHLIIYPPTK